MRFEWDDQKAVENLAKHGVTFGEATEVFYDPNAVEVEDDEHSLDETRFVIIGNSTSRLLFVVFAYMKNTKDKTSESPPDEIELVVTQNEYEAGLKRGWTDDDMLKPGRYKFKRGGFLARHPELKLKEKKRA